MSAPEGRAPISSGDAVRPAVVPAELRPAWELLEQGAVRAVVVDADGGALWPVAGAAARRRELARRLAADGHLHPAFTAESFAVLLDRADARVPAGARPGEVWALVPEWAHPGRTRAQVEALDLELAAEDAVPDPDVAAFLAAVATTRLPVAAVTRGRLSGDRVRRLLEHPALDPITWRAVVGATDHGPDADLVALAAPDDGDARPVLHLAAGPAAEGPSRVVVRVTDDPAADAVERLRARVAAGDEAAAIPEPLAAAWTAGATVLGPVLAGFAEWSVRHAAGHPGGVVVCAAEPGALLPELVEAVAGALNLPLAVRAVPLTPDLVAVAGAGDAAIGAALGLGLAGGLAPAEVAARLGLEGDVADLAAVVEALRTDAAARERAAARAGELRDAALAAVAPETPGAVLTLCQVGGAGTLQAGLTDVLRRAGAPRHVAGLHLATDAGAADAVLVAGGGEVHGYLANLGVPAAAAEAVAAWRPRLEALAGAPDRARTDLAAVAPSAGDRAALELEAARRGAHAYLRAHLRLLAVAGYRATLLHAGPRLSALLAAADDDASVPAAPRPADGPAAPPWLATTVAALEAEVADARAEAARVRAITTSRRYRAAVRAMGLLDRARGR